MVIRAPSTNYKRNTERNNAAAAGHNFNEVGST
jgi:hypothetical protein